MNPAGRWHSLREPERSRRVTIAGALFMTQDLWRQLAVFAVLLGRVRMEVGGFSTAAATWRLLRVTLQDVAALHPLLGGLCLVNIGLGWLLIKRWWFARSLMMAYAVALALFWLAMSPTVGWIGPTVHWTICVAAWIALSRPRAKADFQAAWSVSYA